jgi:hypothetical protein
MRSARLFAVLLIIPSLVCAQALADDEDKPFAEARIVLQSSCRWLTATPKHRHACSMSPIT